MTVAPGDVEQAAEAVVLGLEQPGRVVERPLQPLRNDRLDERQNLRSGTAARQAWNWPDLRQVRAGGPIG